MNDFTDEILRLQDNIDKSNETITLLESGVSDMGVDGSDTQWWLEKHKEIVRTSIDLIEKYKKLASH